MYANRTRGIRRRTATHGQASEKTVREVDVSGQWTGELHATWNGGGVTTTSGNLVFQGQSTGELYVYSADTGEQLHVVDVGASIMAAPTTYVVDGEQYVAVMAGLGGAVGQTHPPGTAATTYGNEGQIIALKLGGGEVPKRPVRAPGRTGAATARCSSVNAQPNPGRGGGLRAMRSSGDIAWCVIPTFAG